jgi:hypothetical protein
MMSALAPESSSGQVHDFEVVHQNDRYVVRAVGDQLRIGRQTPDGPAWLGITMSVAELGGEARRALATGDTTCPALLIGLRFLVSAALTPDSTLHQRRRGSAR